MRNSSLIHLALLTGLALACAPAATLARGADAPRQHDGGFFLRLSAGPGAASIHSHLRNVEAGDGSGNGTKFQIDGTSGDGNLAIGAIVSPNLAVHGTAWGWTASDPTLKLGGQKQTPNDLTVSMNAVGAGVTWYFGQNFYLSGSLGAATLTAKVDRVSVDSQTGAAIDLTIGKEWWVGRRWGLGVAAGFGATHIPIDDPDLEDHFNGSSFGLRFSATFN